MTARKSAPASTSGPQFSWVMPPIAQHGTIVVSLQSRSTSGSARNLRPGFGGAGEKGAERDIVGAGLGGGDRAIAAAAAGHPDDAVGPQEPARLGVGHVLLADMDAVAIELGGEIGTVVHDESDGVRLRYRLQHRGRAPDRGVVDIFEPQLQAGDIAARQCLLEFFGEAVRVERRRRNQVKPRRRRCFVAR